MSTAVCRSFLPHASLPNLSSAAPDAPVAFNEAFIERRLAQHHVWQDDEAARLADGIVEEVLAHEQELRHELNRMRVLPPARRV